MVFTAATGSIGKILSGAMNACVEVEHHVRMGRDRAAVNADDHIHRPAKLPRNALQ